MRLTQWTDYSLRVLMHCAANEDRPQATTIGEIAQAHDISRSHLTKIVMTLAAQGFLVTTRGRGGGLRLKRPAASITVGEVVRHTETDFQQVECFNRDTNQCAMDGRCGLKQAIGRALASYLAELDRVTLADITADPAPDTGSAANRTGRSGGGRNAKVSWRFNVER